MTVPLSLSCRLRSSNPHHLTWENTSLTQGAFRATYDVYSTFEADERGPPISGQANGSFIMARICSVYEKGVRGEAQPASNGATFSNKLLFRLFPSYPVGPLKPFELLSKMPHWKSVGVLSPILQMVPPSMT